TSDRRRRALSALRIVGLQHRGGHRPTELSGGEQQRLAIARALVTNPRLLLADEPTGNLDTRSTFDILALFQRLNEELGLTVVLVTHEHDVGECAKRIIAMRDGEIERDQPVVDRRQVAPHAAEEADPASAPVAG